MRNWLREGEQVELRCRQHARILVLPLAAALILVFAAAVGLGKLQPGPFSQWAPGAEAWREYAVAGLLAVAGFLLLAYPGRRVLRWTNTRYVLTNQRLLVRRGLFGRVKETIVLEQVREVLPVQKWRQKMVGSGDLELHMFLGPVHTVAEVPALKRFNEEIQKVWTMAIRAVIQHAPRDGDYSSEVEINEKELRKLGRDH